MIFLTLLFRLKALYIYMHEEFESEEVIEDQMIQLKCIAVSYIMFILVATLIDYVGSY